MGQAPPAVVFLSRATRIVGALCLFFSLVAGGIRMLSDPNIASASPPEIIHLIEPIAILYLLPGLILLICGVMVKAGRLWPAPIILLISFLSLFKLVLLLVHLPGPLFNTPLSWELPVRIICAALSVPCVFAWEDLAEVNRTRARRRRRGLPVQSPTVNLPPAPASFPKPPPPSTKIPRRPIRPDDPPTSKTPWS
jgi:hypothetical protein